MFKMCFFSLQNEPIQNPLVLQSCGLHVDSERRSVTLVSPFEISDKKLENKFGVGVDESEMKKWGSAHPDIKKNEEK